MGFKVKRKVFRLVFKDTDLEGLEVMARSLTTGQLIELQEAQKGGMHAAVTTMFAAALVSWNLEDEDGSPVPATLEGVRSMEIDFNNAVIGAWTDAVVGVKAPLSPTSSDGQPSVEASIPMDVPSVSLAS